MTMRRDFDNRIARPRIALTSFVADYSSQGMMRVVFSQ
jgi:hypothetical protein